MIEERTYAIKVVIDRDDDFECDIATSIQTCLEGETIGTELRGAVEKSAVIDSVEITDITGGLLT